MNGENQTIAPSTEPQVQPVPVQQPVMMQPEAVSVPAQKTGKKLVGPIIAGVVVLLLIVGAFVAKAILSSPKAVFKAAINNVYKEMSNVIETVDEKFDIGEKAVELALTTKLESNLEELKDYKLNNLEFSGRIGLDVNHKEALFEGGIKGSSEKVDLSVFIKEGYTYLKASFYEQVIKLEEMSGIDFDEMKEVFDELGNIDIDPKLYNRIIEAYSTALSDSLDSSAMSKESVNVKVAGKKYKVTRNSYKLGEKQVRKLVKETVSNLLKDKDFIKDLAKASGSEESQIKEMLEEAKKEAETIEVKDPVTMNLYSKGLIKTEIVGFELKEGKTSVVWYSIDGNVEINFAEQIKFTVEAGKKASKAKLEVAGLTVLEAEVRSFDNKKVDLDFEFKLDQLSPGAKPIKGTIYYTADETKTSLKGDYKFKIEEDGQYAQISGTYSIEAKDKISSFDISGAVSEKDVDEEKMSKNLEDIINKDEALSSIKKFIEEQMKMQAMKEQYSNSGYGNTGYGNTGYGNTGYDYGGDDADDDWDF